MAETCGLFTCVTAYVLVRNCNLPNLYSLSSRMFGFWLNLAPLLFLTFQHPVWYSSRECQTFKSISYTKQSHNSEVKKKSSVFIHQTRLKRYVWITHYICASAQCKLTLTYMLCVTLNKCYVCSWSEAWSMGR